MYKMIKRCSSHRSHVRNDEVHSGEMNKFIQSPVFPRKKNRKNTENRKFSFAAVLRLKIGLYQAHLLFVFIQEVNTKRVCLVSSDCWNKLDLERFAAVPALAL